MSRLRLPFMCYFDNTVWHWYCICWKCCCAAMLHLPYYGCLQETTAR